MTRYIASPTNLEEAPFGALCSVFLNDEGTQHEVYVQTSRDETAPEWVSVKSLLITVYKDKLEDPLFIKELLEALRI